MITCPKCYNLIEDDSLPVCPRCQANLQAINEQRLSSPPQKQSVQSNEEKENVSGQKVCPKCGTVNPNESTFCSACLIPLQQSKSQESDSITGATIAAYVIGGIGVLIGFIGIQELLGDSNVLGLYCYIPIALALLASAWAINRSNR